MLSKRPAFFLLLVSIVLLAQLHTPLSNAQVGRGVPSDRARAQTLPMANPGQLVPTVLPGRGTWSPLEWTGGMSRWNLDQPNTNAILPAPPTRQTVPSSSLDFLPAAIYGSGGRGPSSIAVADVNGDGKPDLIVSNYCVSVSSCNDGNVAVLLGNGDGTFQPAVAYAVGSSTLLPGATSVAVADVNGDGKPDILVTIGCYGRNACFTTPAGAVGVLLGNGDGSFQPVVSYGTGGYDAYSVAVADVNGDGKPDLLIANQCDGNSSCPVDESLPGTIGVLLGNGDGTFQAPASYGPGGNGTSSIAVADIDEDGNLDLVVTNGGNGATNPEGTVAVLLGNGDGTFRPAVTYTTGGASPVSVAVADVNGDGRLDLVVANECARAFACNSGQGTLGVLLGNGDGTLQPATSYSSGGFVAQSVSVRDLNEDGKPDLLVVNECFDASCANNSSGTVDILWGNGDGTFQPAVNYASGTLGNGDFGYMRAADVNGDGKPDLLVANGICGTHGINGPDCIGVLLNNTTPITLTTSANPIQLNKLVTFTAAAAGTNGVVPTGTITFYNGTTAFGMVSLNNAGQAIFNREFVTSGTKSITALYSGDATFPPNTSPVLLEGVGGDPTVVNVGSNLDPALVGQSVTLTAHVSSAFGSPTGTVTFYKGGVSLGSATLSGGLGSINYTFVGAGMKSITAVYSGDANFAASTSFAFNQVVNQVVTTTTLVSNLNPSTVGETVTFTATVSSGSGTPTGTVTFYNNTANMGTATLSGGQAIFNKIFVSAGAKLITAVYSGDATFASSTSPELNQVVDQATTTTTLVSSVNPSVVGQLVTFTATVTPQFGGSPTGTVTFMNGTATMGTVTISGGQAKFNKKFVIQGMKSITANYSGDPNFTASSGGLIQTVN